MKPITIIGGGLAGLTLGIGLRRRDIPAVVWEAGEYPRHRVCGEFICGRGQFVLDELGLAGLLREAGAIEVRTARFVSDSVQPRLHQLPRPALCLSRHQLDALLAREFERLGGELRTNSRWRRPDGEGVVHATGRSPEPMENGWRWLGLKAHATNVDLPADLEMHLIERGYVGVNRIDCGKVNVCGLFRVRPGESLPRSRIDWLRGPPDTLLGRRLANARFDEASVCSVGGLSFRSRHPVRMEGLSIGDAFAMIPPVTGNGMSIAFESATAVLDSLEFYSSGKTAWQEAAGKARAQCHAAFRSRLAWARLLHRLILSRMCRGPGAGWIVNSPWLWNLFYRRTR